MADRRICEIAAHINETEEIVNHTGNLYFHKQPNLKILIEPDEISDFFEQCDNTVFVKQRTEIWQKICEMCAVTGSTMHQAIGLGTLQEQKDHYDYKMKRKEKPEPNEQIKKMMDYGTENEVS